MQADRLDVQEGRVAAETHRPDSELVGLLEQTGFKRRQGSFGVRVAQRAERVQARRPQGVVTL